MRLWMDVWNATYTNKLGDGPIFLKSASFSRALDETGDGAAEMMDIDPRVVDLLDDRRICEIWVHETGFPKRRLGAFIIEKDTATDTQSSSTSISGRSVMVALKNKITLPGLSYNAETVEAVVEDLAELAGWTASVEAEVGSEFISVPFNGDSVLRALQVVAETMGVHLRASSNTNEIEFGAFGDLSDAYIDVTIGDGGEIHTHSDSLLLLERISILRESSQIFNWALAFPGGEGDANDYMGLSTRSFVDEISQNGRTHYIIKNDASIAEYGQIERRVDAKRMTPVDITDSAIVAAANAAADAIKAKLDRMAFPQEVLSITARNVRKTVNVGDKIYIRYRGIVDKNGIPYRYRDIDGEFWVMRASEQVGAGGITLTLEVSNIDRYQADAAGLVVGMVDAIQVQKVSVQPYPTTYPWGPFQQPIDTVTGVEFRFPIFDSVLRLNSVKAYLIRDYWTAVIGEAGGVHRHLIASAGATSNSVNGEQIFGYDFPTTIDGAGVMRLAMIIRGAGSLEDIYTAGESDAHSHPFDAVERDDQLPENLSVTVNGQAVISNVFPYGDEEMVAEFEITDAVRARAGGFRGWHEMEIECGAGRGDLSVVIVVDVDISKVRAS